MLTVVDGGANDADGLANGVLKVNNVLPGTYTITETIAPVGYAIDPTPSRTVVVSSSNLNASCGTQGSDQPGETNVSDFHDAKMPTLGSISWEKRTTGSNPALLGGATFTVTPNPLTGVGVLTVVDGGANDADGLANGVLKVNNVLPGTYTITETVAPVGYAIDPTPSRTVVVSSSNLNASCGTQGSDQPGETNVSDFHDAKLPTLGSISWEKRTTGSNPALLGGATFTVTPNPLTGVGVLTVVDGGANDADGLANGVLKVNNVLPGTYTITETVAPVGYAIDPTPSRTVVVSSSNLNASCGTQGSDQPGETNVSDFHDAKLPTLGSISWEKRTTGSNPALLGGATFTVTPNPLTGVGVLTVVDGGANDADGLANGVLKVNNVLPGTYTITETIAPVGYAIDPTPSRTVVVSSSNLNASCGTQGSDQPGETNVSDFHDATLPTTAPTKFYVVDDHGSDHTYDYAANGAANTNCVLNAGDIAPRGAARHCGRQ